MIDQVRDQAEPEGDPEQAQGAQIDAEPPITNEPPDPRAHQAACCTDRAPDRPPPAPGGSGAGDDSGGDGIATGLSGLYALFMTRETIIQVWESEGVKPVGHTIAVRDDREATCFIETKGELMTVSRVTKLELRDAFIALVTVKDERFVFAYEDILGFKLGGAATPRDRPTGFGR
ncbi:MAG TPA: hypothetical protein VGP07_16540 [Polyangia bacterium]|jgi:hypothetical protein